MFLPSSLASYESLNTEGAFQYALISRVPRLFNYRLGGRLTSTSGIYYDSCLLNGILVQGP